MTIRYELYREKVKILEWRNDSVYRTESLGNGWYSEDEIKNNEPRKSGVYYVAVNNAHKLNIRVAKGSQSD